MTHLEILTTLGFVALAAVIVAVGLGVAHVVVTALGLVDEDLRSLVDLLKASSSERYLHHIRSSAERSAEFLGEISNRIEVREPLPRAPSLLGQTVVIHTVDRQSLRGIVLAEYSDRVDVEQGQWLERRGSTAAGGVQAIPRTNIRVIQILPPSPVAVTPPAESAE